MVGVVLIVEVEVKCVKQQMCIMGVDATNGVLVKGGLVTTRGEKEIGKDGAGTCNSSCNISSNQGLEFGAHTCKASLVTSIVF